MPAPSLQIKLQRRVPLIFDVLSPKLDRFVSLPR